MKKFFFRLFFLLIPVTVVMGFMEVKLAEIPNSYSYKRVCFEKNLDSTQILILGSSQSLYGINPDYFKLQAFNLSDISQDIFFDKELTLRYLPQMPSLKYVIINLPYFSFGYSLVDGTEAWRIFYYSQYWGIDHPEENRADIKRWSRFFLYTPNTSLNYLMHGFHENLATNMTNKGFYRAGLSEGENHAGDSTGYQRVKLHNGYFRENRFKENEEYVEELIAALKKRGVEVILITPPVLPYYYKYADAGRLQRNRLIINALCSKFNCKYFDFFKDSRFGYSDFVDNDHLNFRGAVRFSLMLNQLITSMQNGDKLTKPATPGRSI